MRKIFILLIISLIFWLGIFIWRGIYLPKDLAFLETEDKLFSIEKGQNLFQIAENLEKEGLIKNKYFFDLYVLIQGKARKLQAGEYKLNSSSMNIAEIAKKIISGDTLKIKIIIPEGFTLKQIEAKLSENFQRPVLWKFNRDSFSAEFGFLKDSPTGAPLEGFLFPDTYYFFPNISDEKIVQKFLANFDKKLSLDLREEIKNQKKTIFEIVTMASLIEKEVSKKEDKELVSGILWKRLENNMPLQVDATIVYITGKKTTRISIEETKIDSPYNTYKYLGLPPGPISNPGLESIKAALYPKDSEYWYYLSIPEGKTIFSKTLEEHNYAKAKYMLKQNISGKKIVMIVAFRDFRDAEYFLPKEILETAGAEVKTASNKMGRAIGADGGDVEIDLLVSEINPDDFDAVIFVGGPGALKNLDNETSYRLVREVISQNKVLASICISPVILAKSGMLKGKKATVWSSPIDRKPVKILEENGAIYQDKLVVVDGKIVTANGPGAAKEFGQAIIDVLTE